jgi:hypothetical protein
MKRYAVYPNDKKEVCTWCAREIEIGTPCTLLVEDDGFKHHYHPKCWLEAKKSGLYDSTYP